MSRDCPKKRKPKCHNCGGPHREDGTWLLQLVSSENTSIGNPFIATKPALYKTQEEADAALSARLAGLRDC